MGDCRASRPCLLQVLHGCCHNETVSPLSILRLGCSVRFCVFEYVCVCMLVSVFVCVYVFACMCAYVCVCMYRTFSFCSRDDFPYPVCRFYMLFRIRWPKPLSRDTCLHDVSQSFAHITCTCAQSGILDKCQDLREARSLLRASSPEGLRLWMPFTGMQTLRP